VEIKKIVKKRREFEHLLDKRIAEKNDFVSFIEYESLLESLRVKRRHRLLASLKAEAKARGEAENAVVWKGSISDHSIKQRIHYLYDRALRKFPSDVQLWMAYIDWCQLVDASKAAAKAIGRAIQLHPTKSVFWIVAAKYEYEELSNISAARTLLQRGLRVNSDNQELWLEYFKLELAYIEKSRIRREVLFGKRQRNDQPVDEAEDNGNIVLDEVDAPEQDIFKADEVVLGMQVPESDALQDEFFNGAIPKAIYRNAIKAIPDDLEFRRAFLEIYIRFGGWTKSGQQEWFDSLRLVDSAAARALMAGRHIFGLASTDLEFPQSIKSSLNEFKTAVNELNSIEIVQEYHAWLKATMETVDEANIRKALSLANQKLYTVAKERGICSVDVWLQHGTSVQDFQAALKQYPANLTLWTRLIELNPTRETFEAAIATFRGTKQLTDVWKRYWTWILESDSDAAEAQLKTALHTHFRGHESRFHILWLALHHCGETALKFADEFRDRFRQEYQYYLTLARWELGLDETAFPKHKHNANVAQIRKWLEQAVICMPNAPEPWLFYIAYELNATGDVAKSLSLFSRAKKHVKDSRFLQEYNRLTQ